MKYDWESELSDDIQEALDEFVENLPEGFYLRGIGVVSEEAVEAAFIDVTTSTGMAEADILNDIKGDVDAAYDASVIAMRK